MMMGIFLTTTLLSALSTTLVLAALVRNGQMRMAWQTSANPVVAKRR